MKSENTKETEVPKKNRFRMADLRGFKQMWPYLRPHKFGFAFGIILISISSILTLFVTRLWGQLGGVGIMGDATSDIETCNCMRRFK